MSHWGEHPFFDADSSRQVAVRERQLMPIAPRHVPGVLTPLHFALSGDSLSNDAETLLFGEFHNRPLYMFPATD